MSPYARYVMEREGNSVLEDGDCFLEYKISGEICILRTIFVPEELRLQGKGSALTKSVTRIALEAGCKLLWSQVWLNTLNGNDSLKAHLAYGFTAIGCEKDYIILTMDIGG